LSYVVLGIVAGLASVERKGFLQAMLARPIALGTLLGFALGDVPGGLLLAVPLELFWLGAVNLGAALPVHEALGTAAITGGAILAGQAMGTGVTPEIAVLAALLCAPLALLGRRADRLTEIWNEGLARRAERVLAAGRPAAAARSNVYGLALPFLIGAVLAPAGAFLAALLVPALLGRAPAAAAPLAGAWAAFAGLACASGAKALRARAAAPVFFLALAAATAVGLTWWRLA
jgi:mannose/fructose/N-acetylgalactosamine-specific phosphotransferase system component IIC